LELAVFPLLLAVALIAQSSVEPARCWTSVSGRPQYTAADQVRDLQSLVKAGGCDVVGLAWTSAAPAAPAAPAQHLVVLWDAKEQILWRLKMEGQSPRWEKWSGASKERILADNPADGFTLGTFSQGKGRAAMTTSAGGFVKQHAPGTFDAALPENCGAPSPSANTPPFLTKCGG
jgi:hypothetical protein